MTTPRGVAISSSRAVSRGPFEFPAVRDVSFVGGATFSCGRTEVAFPGTQRVNQSPCPGFQRSRSLQNSWKLSTDPQFIGKVRDVVGLRLDPPDKALVLCVDVKSQIQALDRTGAAGRGPVRAFGRLVRNADGDWFEGPVSAPLIMTSVVRAPMHAVPLTGASLAGLADRYEYDGVVEGTAIVTGTWTGSALRVEYQVPAAQPDGATQVFQDRAPRTLRFHWIRREAEEVRNHLREHWAGWNIYSIGIIGDHVEARLTRVLPDMAAWMETLPAAILALEPWLTPATQRVVRRSLCPSPCACPAATS